MLFYRFARRLTWLLLMVFFRLKVTGREHIPAQGPLMAVANHESFLDPFVVGVVLMKRHATFLAAPWLYTRPVAKGFLRRIGSLPAYGDGNEVAALRESIRILQRSGTVVIFPQGGIGRSQISGGAVFIALKAQAAVVPMRITGAGRALPLKRWWPSLFTRITVDVGAPIAVAELRTPGMATSTAVDRGVELLTQLLMPWATSESASR
jgi:1-acyl-sn-glycerol-3-phosphate acyltransferase